MRFVLIVALVLAPACVYRGHQTQNLIVVLGTGAAGGLVGYGVTSQACGDCTLNQHMEIAAIGLALAWLVDTVYFVHDMRATWEAERLAASNVEPGKVAPPVNPPDPMLPLYRALADANTACGKGDQDACAHIDALQHEIDVRSAR